MLTEQVPGEPAMELAEPPGSPDRGGDDHQADEGDRQGGTGHHGRENDEDQGEGRQQSVDHEEQQLVPGLPVERSPLESCP